ncbi:MAG: L-lactate dehydrogenase [Anaerolineales bacterium]
MQTMYNPRKVVIVGAGAVGSTFAYALAQKSLADEISLLDVNPEYAEGQVLDLAHGLPYYPSVEIYVGEKEDYVDAHVIVITAGAKQAPGESRLDLLQKNTQIIEGIIDDILSQKSQAIIVVASNPVDVLTHVALKHSGWPKNRVIGSGTVLDSARFRYLLSQHCSVDVGNVHAYILGEHGDTEFAAWSMTHIGGVPINEYCPMCEGCDDWATQREKIVKTVKESAYHIINYKGATYFAIGMALTRIVGTILQDQRSVLTVSTLLEGEYDIEDVCLGIPCVVGKDGISQIVEANLTPDERKLMQKSAATLKNALNELYEN